MLPLKDSIRMTRAYNHSLGARIHESPPQIQCHYCRRRPGVTKDHIVPKALGGTNHSWNIVPACQKCNGIKGDSWPVCPCSRCVAARKAFFFIREEHSISVLTESLITSKGSV